MAERYASRTLREIARILASRVVGILVILAVVIAGTYLLTMVAPRWYRSEAELLAEPGRTVDPLAAPTAVARDEVTLFVQTQRQIIESDFVIASALMRLEGRPARATAALPDEMHSGDPNRPLTTRPIEDYRWYDEKAVSDYIAENLQWVAEVRERCGLVMPAGADAAFTQTFSIRVDWREDAERAADPKLNPQQLSPRAFAAQQAQKYAQYLVEAYLLRLAEIRTRRSRQASRLLANQLMQGPREELRKAEDALKKFVERPEVQGNLPVLNMMLSPSVGGGEPGAAFLSTQAQSDLNRVEVDLAGMRALKKSFATELAKFPETDAEFRGLLKMVESGKDLPEDNPFQTVAVPDVITSNNPMVGTLQTRILTLKLDVNRLEEKYTGDYEDLANMRAELAKAMREFHDELKRQAQRIDQRIAELAAQQKSLSETVGTRREQMDKLASLAATYQQLRLKHDLALRVFQDRYQEALAAEMAQKLAENPILVTVIDTASPAIAKEPRRPIVWLNLLIAVVAGVVLALVYAFLSDYFDHSLKSIDDAERYLGIPVLASIPKVRGRIIRSTGG